MSTIVISEPDGPYKATIDTEVMDVTVYKCFTGMTFISEAGERLSVSMRDSGFELLYSSDDEPYKWSFKLNDGLGKWENLDDPFS